MSIEEASVASISKAELKDIILDALSSHYTSYSSKDRIITGNRYQTVRLGRENVAGFRSARNPLFEALDFKGKSVLDLGCNLGETSRSALGQGATKVVGLEYDHLFVLVSKLINLHEGIDAGSIEFRQADITKDEVFSSAFDYTLALSVFTFMGSRLKEISSCTRRALVVETHNLDREDRIDGYLSTIAPHFETTVVAGYSDWGTSSEFANGKRAYVLAFKQRESFWEFISRCQERRPALSCLTELNLASVPPALSLLQRYGIPSDEKLLDVPRDQYLHEAFDLPYPYSASHLAYWLEFRRGYLDAKRAGKVDFGNPYIRLLQALISNGDLFDPGAMESMKDPAVLLERCSQRIDCFESKEDLPVVLFDRRGAEETFELLTTNGDPLTCSTVDGQHRLAAAMMLGRGRYPAYHFPIIGNL